MNKPCEKMKDKITDYILGILNESEIANLEEHIEQCAECKELLESLQKEREVLLQLGENIDSKMNAREESVIAALEKISHKKSIKPTFFYNRVFRFAAAAVIAIALLIPLSYGANNLIKRLIAGQVEYDDYKGEFALDKDIRVELRVGNKEKQDIIKAYNIRFFVEDGELRGTLRLGLESIPKFKWMTKIELFDSKNTKLVSTEHVNENTGIATSYDSYFACAIHFTLGKTGDISDIKNFIVIMKETSDKIKTTPDAWSETDKLNIVSGRVTGPDGKPIANAIVKIREKGKPGQAAIMTLALITDENGFYSYDQLDWEHEIGVLVYNRDGYKHQYKRLNKSMTKSQVVDFKIDNFPTGNSSISGTVQSHDGTVIREFSVYIRSKVDLNDYSGEYLYQFGYEIPFVTRDGKFEIKNLPATTYDVTIYPTKEKTLQQNDRINRKEFVCELQEGQKYDVGLVNDGEKLYYGRVLFEDGTPAVPEISEYKTQVVFCSEDSESGETIATVGDEGYFSTVLSKEKSSQLESGKASLKLCIAVVRSYHFVRDCQLLPFDLLSSKRDSTGTATIKRPIICYGRILHENGKPANLEVMPWEGAKVLVMLRTAPADSNDGVLSREICSVDDDGYFRACFNEEQIDKLQAGTYKIEIYHPTYMLMAAAYPVIYPFDKLSMEKENVDGYKIINARNQTSFKGIGYYLDSIERLKGLYSALEKYANNNQKNYPDMLGELDIENENNVWLAENIEYFPVTKSQDISVSAKTVIAFDKTLLEQNNAALVLFGDGHIEYCRTRELEILGIKKPETNLTP